jgi:hypothetical protein
MLITDPHTQVFDAEADDGDGLDQDNVPALPEETPRQNRP